MTDEHPSKRQMDLVSFDGPESRASNQSPSVKNASADRNRSRQLAGNPIDSSKQQTEPRKASTKASRQEFFIPVSGFTWLYPEEVQVVNHPSFQRLGRVRSEEHTSELQSPYDLVCRLLLEK